MSEMSEGEYQEHQRLADEAGREDNTYENLQRIFGSPFVDPTDKRLIAPHIKKALDDWNRGQSYPTGDFLRAVLTNDLMGAFLAGDDYNLKTLHAIVAYVYNELRWDNHGSHEKYYAWIKLHQDMERHAPGDAELGEPMTETEMEADSRARDKYGDLMDDRI